MSVFVKDMDMPISCKKCPFQINRYCQRLYDIDSDNNIKIPYGIFYNGYLPDCPLVEIPTPHGRLIDADAHIKLLKENHCGERCRRNHDCFTCGIDMYIRIVENEATVIGAEVE